jgi:hypothetical protein
MSSAYALVTHRAGGPTRSPGRGTTADLGFRTERVRGIEPPFRAWEARVLPLNYTRGSDGTVLARPSPPQRGDGLCAEAANRAVPHPPSPRGAGGTDDPVRRHHP